MKLYQVDSFTSTRFSGNPAGVCIMENSADEKWMQNIAAEMNLSETAFLYPKKSGYNLRWFTPQAEVDLCGHATLASAHILYEKEIIEPAKPISFFTNSGELIASKESDKIKLNFPATPPVEAPPADGLLDALNLESVVYCGKNKFDYLLELPDEHIVRSIKPNFSSLKEVSVRGIIITARSESDKYDVVSRMFAPAVGIDEDPVTGSAHCTLGPYWMNQLKLDSLKCYQASHRGGELLVKKDGDRIHLIGSAITVFELSLVN